MERGAFVSVEVGNFHVSPPGLTMSALRSLDLWCDSYPLNIVRKGGPTVPHVRRRSQSILALRIEIPRSRRMIRKFRPQIVAVSLHYISGNIKFTAAQMVCLWAWYYVPAYQLAPRNFSSIGRIRYTTMAQKNNTRKKLMAT